MVEAIKQKHEETPEMMVSDDSNTSVLASLPPPTKEALDALLQRLEERRALGPVELGRCLELADATDATHAHDDVADNDVLIAEAATLREQVEMSNYVEQIALAAIADDDDEESGE